MSTNDYVKFITQTFVKHFNQPKIERKKNRAVRKEKRLPLIDRWFGIIPYALKLFFKKKR
ncbi:hypothetical protein J2S13_000246 [Oikeobacillus pervagus]|uniref:YqzE family protein n=1 Tax=Oikeobacillus pervagus TaxID=1325931 RepID=A0AAJ1SY41_9BACI|nr:YqzE family protein [Oikeobacillus pervagus]MDQ0213852.1 hypothetical protein [Oikeobacillus pervagus]